MSLEKVNTFYETLFQLELLPEVQELKKFRQHKYSDRFTHCHNVAVYSYHLALKFHWDIDEESLAKGAFLHDFFEYDTKNMQMSNFQHGMTHPFIALENAMKVVDLNEKEKNIIVSHMWPYPFSPMPRSKEAYLVTLADKYCACREALGIGNIENILAKKHFYDLETI